MSIVRNNICTTRYLQNGNILIVDYDNSKIYEINDIALFIWEQIEHPLDLCDIATALSEAYAVDYDIALSDVKTFVDHLTDLGLIINHSIDGVRRRVISKELRGALKKFGTDNLIPIRAILELTDKCNLKCVHCYRVASSNKILSLPEIKAIINDLCELGCIELTLTGGELFTRSDIFDIIDYADQRNFSINILTNGTLIDQTAIDKLARYSSIGCVQISLYSEFMEIHDQITQYNGAFSASYQAAVGLRKKGIRVKFACPVMSLNFTSYSGVKRIANDIGCEVEFNYPITAKEDGDKQPLKYRLSDKELLHLFRECKEFFCGEYTHNTDDPPCCAGRSLIYISDTGNLYPCLMYPNPFGSIRSGNLKKIWHGSSELKKYRGLVINDFIRCKKCDNIQWCPICPGLNLLENGNEVDPAQITCKMAWANRVIATEGGVESGRV